jgi:hypothetical protein
MIACNESRYSDQCDQQHPFAVDLVRDEPGERRGQADHQGGHREHDRDEDAHPRRAGELLRHLRQDRRDQHGAEHGQAARGE